MWPKTYHWSLPITEENKFSFYFVLSLSLSLTLSLDCLSLLLCACTPCSFVHFILLVVLVLLFRQIISYSTHTHTHTWLLVCFSSLHQYKQTRTHARKRAHTYTSQWSFGPKKPTASLPSMSTVPLLLLFENLVRYRRDTHVHLYISSTAVIDRFLVASILFSIHMHIELIQCEQLSIKQCQWVKTTKKSRTNIWTLPPVGVSLLSAWPVYFSSCACVRARACVSVRVHQFFFMLAGTHSYLFPLDIRLFFFFFLSFGKNIRK